ncbi:MAG: hypothetical protein JRJ85_00425 [Deltaproteobacteria bacterium]|nr:hypothetical protein [Deltaproteobacteria bacterium]
MNEPYTLVLFEAPHRLEAMLSDMADILGDRPVVLLREMTKMYEEVLPSTARSLLERVKARSVRGEITLVVKGAEDGKTNGLEDAVKGKLEKLLKDRTMSIKDIARKVAREEGGNYRHIYRECLHLDRQLSAS